MSLEVVHSTGSKIFLSTLEHGPVSHTTSLSELPDLTPTVEISSLGLDSIEQLSAIDDSVPNIDIQPSTYPPEPSLNSTTVAPAVTPAMRWRARLQYGSVCFVFFLAGWNDGTTGSLLPRIQEVYHIGFAVVSILFVMNCIGFIGGSAINVYLMDKVGFGKTLVIGSLSPIIGYTILATAPPFPLVCVSYLLSGFGLALMESQANGYVASLKENTAAKMGFAHAVYGLGALTSPLAATHFAQVPRWSFLYLASLGCALINAALLIFVFRGRSHDECLIAIGQSANEAGTSGNKYRQIMGQKVLHLLAFWALIYVGIEVTIGGWTVTYIIQRRGGGPSAGYISSGFFGGLTLGRVSLLWINRKIGERRILFIYLLLVIGLELTVWLIPSLIGNAVAVSIVGLFLGPMYPILMNQSAALLPPWLLTGSIGWIAGLGQTGSALLPFMTGAIASKFGITSLQPFLIAFMATLGVIWASVPKPQHRHD